MFRKSSKCDANTCVEVDTTGGVVRVRNSADPSSIVEFSRTDWRAFIKHITR